MARDIHSVHVDELELISRQDRDELERGHIAFSFRPAPAMSHEPIRWRPNVDTCAHGYVAPTCPDCDVPSYWPAVLDS